MATTRLFILAIIASAAFVWFAIRFANSILGGFGLRCNILRGALALVWFVLAVWCWISLGYGVILLFIPAAFASAASAVLIIRCNNSIRDDCGMQIIIRRRALALVGLIASAGCWVAFGISLASSLI